MLKTLCIAAGVLALATPALASGDGQTSSQPVSLAGVDFHNGAGAQEAYARLKVAATKVCSLYIASARVTDVDEVCVERALTSAVRDVNQPQLTALLNGDGPRLASTGRGQRTQ